MRKEGSPGLPQRLTQGDRAPRLRLPLRHRHREAWPWIVADLVGSLVLSRPGYF